MTFSNWKLVQPPPQLYFVDVGDSVGIGVGASVVGLDVVGFHVDIAVGDMDGSETGEIVTVAVGTEKNVGAGVFGTR